MKLITRQGKIEVYWGSNSDGSNVYDVKIGNVNFTCNNIQAAYRVAIKLNEIINLKDVIDTGYDE